MKAKISTVIKTSEEKMWKELQKISSLMHVTSPLLKFKALDAYQLPDKWEIGKEHQLKLLLFGIIPLGRHFIKIIEIDPEEKLIVSAEHGFLTKTWNHFIKIDSKDDSNIIYTDEIEIKAGVFTLSIWLFAHIFYRYRQRRWKELLKG